MLVKQKNKLAISFITVMTVGLIAQSGFCSQRLNSDSMPETALQSVEEVIRLAGRPVHVWESPEHSARVNLLCVHGLGLSSTDYDKFGNHVTKFGIRTYALSVDGFGPAQERAENARLNFETTIRGIESTIDEIRKRHPGEPVFLLGESLGGTIALDFAARFPGKIDGLICSTPTWRYYGEGSVKLRSLVSLILGPWARRALITRPIVTRATSDPELRKHWLYHPDHRLDLRVKEAFNIVTYIRKTPERAKQIDQVPVLFVQGLNDRLCKPLAVARLFRILASQNKRLVLDCGQEHVIFEEGRFSNDSAAIVLSWLSLQTEKFDSYAISHPSGALISSNGTTRKEKAQIKKFFKKAGLHNLTLEDQSSLGCR